MRAFRALRLRPASTRLATLKPLVASRSNVARRLQHTDKNLSQMTREWCTARLNVARLETKTSYASIAKAVGRSEVWTTSAVLGQQQMSGEEALALVNHLQIADTQERSRLTLLLQECPSKGALHPTVPTDPLIYRFYELVQVYGTTWKALIHEKLGDGIMSAIDFTMHLDKEKGSHGEDRIRVTFSGKFLPYKKW